MTDTLPEQPAAKPDADLADRLRLVVTRLARRLRQEGSLERDGLVVREPDPHDGRVARVRLSTEGRRVLRRLRGRKQAYLERRLRGLDDDERATLERAAAILERLLREER
jgi:DNA-binding MarR family transcriptional regulator